MEKPDERIADSSRPWWRRILTLPGLIATAILTGAVSWGVTQVLSEAQRSAAVRDPLAVSVETNPASIEMFSDLSQTVVFPRRMRTLGSPGVGCEGFHEWSRRQGGVDSGTTKMELVVQGKVAAPVLIRGFRVRKEREGAPLKGTAAVCPSAGEAQIRVIAIDLDAEPPKVRYASGKRPAVFTVAKDETEVFDIIASTRRAYHRWRLEIDVVAEGKRQTIPISMDGRPFETTPEVKQAWSWDYEKDWIWNSPELGGTSLTVQAGTALPPVWVTHPKSHPLSGSTKSGRSRRDD